MASGKTLEMMLFSRQMGYRAIEPLERKPRDRKLAGKARIRARRSSRRDEAL